MTLKDGRKTVSGNMDTKLEELVGKGCLAYLRMNQGSKHQMVRLEPSQPLKALSLQQGQTVYLEGEEQEGEWASQLDIENNRISIKYNLLGTDSFDLVINIDGRHNIGQLRQAIQTETGISEDLIMRRGNRIGQELKNEKSSIQDCNIINYS